jgi:plastocyanin
MKKIAAMMFPLLMILVLGVTACGQASSQSNASTPANEVDMGATNFVQTSVTIRTGQSVHFVDQQSGTMHILCIGKDGRCDANAKAPQDLIGQGFTIQPGQSHDVRFDTAGTYSVTCTLHPTMNLSVTIR